MISGRACRDRISVRAFFSVCIAHVSLFLTVAPPFWDGLSKLGSDRSPEAQKNRWNAVQRISTSLSTAAAMTGPLWWSKPGLYTQSRPCCPPDSTGLGNEMSVQSSSLTLTGTANKLSEPALKGQLVHASLRLLALNSVWLESASVAEVTWRRPLAGWTWRQLNYDVKRLCLSVCLFACQCLPLFIRLSLPPAPPPPPPTRHHFPLSVCILFVHYHCSRYFLWFCCSCTVCVSSYTCLFVCYHVWLYKSVLYFFPLVPFLS